MSSLRKHLMSNQMLDIKLNSPDKIVKLNIKKVIKRHHEKRLDSRKIIITHNTYKIVVSMCLLI